MQSKHQDNEEMEKLVEKSKQVIEQREPSEKELNVEEASDIEEFSKGNESCKVIGI